MLNKYVFDRNISILAVQETGESSSFKKRSNFQMFEGMNINYFYKIPFLPSNQRFKLI